MIKNVLKGFGALVGVILLTVVGTGLSLAMNHIPGVGPAVILAFGTIIFWHYTRNFRNGLQAFRRGRRSSAQQSMRENVMIGQNELRKLVKDTLADLRKTKSRDLFTPDLINTIIDNKTGQKSYVDEVKEILREQWGYGIEPVTIGGQVWKFGPGQPPRSQQI